MKRALCLLLLAGCAGEPKEPETRSMIDAAFKTDLETVSKAHVFFGHHSVGQNLLEGVAMLSKEAGVPIKIDEAPVGKNLEPLTKFEDFAARGEANKGDGTQLILMKLCYVDFNPDSNVDAMLDAYMKAVGRVRAARPGVKILHVTPPLHSRPGGIKTTMQRLLGKQVWEDDTAIKRAEYAAKLKDRCRGEPVFDLSGVESTQPDGGKVIGVVKGREVPFLWSGFTDDGGHLNDFGKKVAGKAFVQALAAALRR